MFTTGPARRGLRWRYENCGDRRASGNDDRRRGMIVGLRVATVVGRLVAVLDGVSDGVLVAVFVRLGEAVSIDCSVGVSVIGVNVSVGLSVGESVAALMMIGTGFDGSRVGWIAAGDEQLATTANARIHKA